MLFHCSILQPFQQWITNVPARLGAAEKITSIQFGFSSERCFVLPYTSFHGQFWMAYSCKQGPVPNWDLLDNNQGPESTNSMDWPLDVEAVSLLLLLTGSPSPILSTCNPEAREGRCIENSQYLGRDAAGSDFVNPWCYKSKLVHYVGRLKYWKSDLAL